MAKFSLLPASEYDPKLRLRIQNTGKIGFSSEVATTKNISEDTYIRFARDEESSSLSLYMIFDKQASKQAFQVKKSGQYFYLNTSRMFDSLGIDYKSQAVFLNMVRTPEFDSVLDGEVFRLDFDYKTTKANESATNTNESEENETAEENITD